MSKAQPWHRLFGISWMDLFDGTDVEVRTECDLSLKQQFLDLVIIRKGPGPISRRMPDGFEELAAHNLVTFKSHQEALDDWAIWELIGHYVNYRKQSSPSMQELLPTSDYRLFAVCARFPQQMARQIALAPLSAGVYELRLGALMIRIVVANQLPEADHNSMLHLFSARAELRRFGAQHYRPYSPDTNSMLFNLLEKYHEETDMASKIKELLSQMTQETLQKLPAEERLKGLAAEERLKGLPAEERLKGLTAEEVAAALPPEVLKELVRQHKANGDAAKPK